MQKTEYMIEEGTRYYYNENGECCKKEPYTRNLIVKYPGEEKTAFELATEQLKQKEIKEK